MKVLVTGANGLLGHHVVMQLIDLMHDVSIVVRSKRNIYFDISKTTVTEGEFTHYETLKLAAQSCDAIIHMAAVTATDLLHYEDYRKINVDGSKLILQVADEFKINNIVFVSTANTIGYGTKERLADESAEIEFPFSKSFYAQSKVEAEKLYVEASKKADRHVVIVNPTFMIGSHDTKPSSGKLMLMGYKKRIMFAPNGGKNFVAVSDVAAAICNALTHGKNGSRYLASDVNLSFKEFYQIQSRVGGYSQKIIVLPDFLLELAGKIGDLVRFLGVKTEICSMNLNQLTIREYYSNQNALKELKMPQKDLEKAISEALNWFKQNNKIRV